MTIIANLKRPWFRMLPDVAEKINDADDFGLEYALKAERRRIREREKKRRQRAKQVAARALVVVDAPSPVATFMTPSGFRAYRKYVPNRTALGSAPLTAKGEGVYVSLPFVSILGVS